MPTLTIDGQEITVEDGMTVLQACESLGIEIPRFCYHERLSIAGNCRMCLVEMEKAPKPVASCAMPVGDGMVIHTNTPQVRNARQGVMEFLLINHPLDCPICDQGGECDLQDQAMAYGNDSSRYLENKRAVKEKYMGPLIKTIMTRCIHCTRCVRFVTEVAGIEDLGAIGRGEDTEITTYLEKALPSELSGNVIDLCPVGALTSKPYAFTARSWELRKTESVDVHDAVGSSIRVDCRGAEVMRVLPRLSEEVNEEWLTDKSRFACDGLKRQRLDTPYVRRDGKLQPATWAEAFEAIAARAKTSSGDKMAAIVGDLADGEAIVALKDLMTGLESPNLECRQDGAALDPSCRAGYLFNTTIAGIEDADACLLIGADPRQEAALINTRLRKRYLASGFAVASIGEPLDLTFPVEDLGRNLSVLTDIENGGHAFAETLKTAERPMLILGQGALVGPDGAAILAAARAIADNTGMIVEDWNGFNVLHTAAARVGALDLGFVPGDNGRDLRGILNGAKAGDIDFVYLLGADEFDTSQLGSAFVIYQGSHGDAGAHRADVILPGAAYTEKNATYVNTEGRVQRGARAIFPPGDAREDWSIIRALSEHVGATLPYDNLAQVRARMVEVAPTMAVTDEITKAEWGTFGTVGSIADNATGYPLGDFYLTNPICRASPTMAECSAVFNSGQGEATGTHG
jgi:NADH-quinone oxidoreductase subunit G